MRLRRLLWLVRHALSPRGARRGLPLTVNLRRVGAAGFLSAAGYVAKEIWGGSLGNTNARDPYLIERGGQPASFEHAPNRCP